MQSALCRPVVVLCLCLLITARATLAQGPAPFAEPLSSADLQRWVEVLQLEGDAKRSAVAAFERSLAEAQALRDGEMAAFERETTNPGDPATTIEVLEQRSKRAKTLVGRQAAIENALFDEIASLVPDSARPALESQRRIAARRRSLASLDMFQRNGLAPDLVQLVADAKLELTPEATATLQDYDQRLTELMHRTAMAALESGPATRRAVQAAPPAPPPSPDGGDEQARAAAREAMRARMAARAAAQLPLNTLRGDILELHRSGFDRLVPLLAADDARTLRSRFLASNYMAVTIKRDTPERLASMIRARAAAEPTIPPETIAAAERIIEQWRQQVEPIERRMMDAVDAQRRDRTGMPISFGDDGEGMAMHAGESGPLGDLRRERDEATVQARQQIAGLHPALEAVARDDEPGHQIAFAPGGALPDGAVVGETRVSAVMVMDNDGGGGMGEAIAIDFSPDMISAPRGGVRPIEPREFDAMMQRMKADEPARATARAAFDAYHRSATARLQAALGDAKADEPMEIGGVGGMAIVSFNEPPKPEVLDAALAGLTAEDDAFFAALGDPSEPTIARERAIRSRERQRQRLSVGGAPMMQPWGRFERTELVAIVAEADVPQDRRAFIDATVAQHGERMSALLGRLVEASEAMRRAEQAFTRVVDHGDGRVERSIEIGPDENNAFMRASRELTSAMESTTAEVRRTLDELSRQLSADAARRIRRAAFAQAMPRIMTDPRSVEPRLDLAIVLETISDSTRIALIELLAAHQDRVDALVDRFVADCEQAAREQGPGGSSGPGEMRALRQTDALQARLRFDRNELNDATMRRLRALLSTEENSKVADLPPAHNRRGASFLSF